jgi:NADP-dependent 3-hydroxy acid dehydrogenase YdfG
MNDTPKLVMITGASSGIGEACAIKYASHGYNLILTGRREERLLKLSSTLKLTYGAECLVLTFDIQKADEVETAMKTLSGKWKEIDVLINNAGLALGLNSIQEGNISDWETMIDTNLKGLLFITRFIAPLMIARKKGHIVNIGSVAGREVYPKGNVYCATKHAVDAISRAMRIDLLPHGIKVSQIAPGAVNTEFSLVRFKGDQQAANNVYQGFQPLMGADVADVVYFVTSLPSHVTINDLLIMPTAQAAAGIIKREE